MAFLTSHLSIHVAASDGNGIATLVRGLGCRIADDEPSRVRLLMSRPQSELVLRAVDANGRIAAVFSEPESHRTIQLRGVDARRESPEAADHALLAPTSTRCRDASRPSIRRNPSSRAAGLQPRRAGGGELHAADLFGQTPGPKAEERFADGAGLP